MDIKTINSNNSGQALIELSVGLIALLVLISAMLQLTSLSDADSRARAKSRKEAGIRSLSELSVLSSPSYITDWNAGDDGSRHTADDEPVEPGSSQAAEVIIDKSASSEEDWLLLDSINGSDLQNLRKQNDPSRFLGLIQADESEEVELLPAVKKLIYSSDSISVEAETWMTWTKGIY